MEFVLQFGLGAFRAGSDGFGVVAVKCARGFGVVAKIIGPSIRVMASRNRMRIWKRKGSIQLRSVLIDARHQQSHTEGPTHDTLLPLRALAEPDG